MEAHARMPLHSLSIFRSTVACLTTTIGRTGFASTASTAFIITRHSLVPLSSQFMETN